jgi:hypothetical protein
MNRSFRGHVIVNCLRDRDIPVAVTQRHHCFREYAFVPRQRTLTTFVHTNPEVIGDMGSKIVPFYINDHNRWHTSPTPLR